MLGEEVGGQVHEDRSGGKRLRCTAARPCDLARRFCHDDSRVGIISGDRTLTSLEEGDNRGVPGLRARRLRGPAVALVGLRLGPPLAASRSLGQINLARRWSVIGLRSACDRRAFYFEKTGPVGPTTRETTLSVRTQHQIGLSAMTKPPRRHPTLRNLRRSLTAVAVIMIAATVASMSLKLVVSKE